MNQQTKANSYYELLLPSSDKEVVRTFESFYVENEFARFKAKGIPEADILKFFHKAQISGANPILDQIYLYESYVSNRNGGYTTVGTIVFSYNFLKIKAQTIMNDKGFKDMWPIVTHGVGEYFIPETEEYKKTPFATAELTINGRTYSYTAWYPEYVVMNKEGKPTNVWKKYKMMLDKCSIMGLLRSLFPEALTGYYAKEEFASYQDEDELEKETIKQKDTDIIIERNEKTQESLERKEEIKNNQSEVEELKEKIKFNLSVFTKKMTAEQKGAEMVSLLGIRSWKSIDTLSLDQLREKSQELEKKVIDAKNKEIENLAKATNISLESEESPPPPSDDYMPILEEDGDFKDSISVELIEPEVLPKEENKKEKAKSPAKPKFKM